jgi:hypothetical protein
MITCPKCAHCFTPPRTRKAPPLQAVASTEDLSTTQLYAVYKKSAPLEDVRFFLRTAVCSPALTAQVQALEAAIVARELTERSAIYRQLTALQDAWRLADYWRRVALPAERIARRRARAQERIAV